MFFEQFYRYDWALARHLRGPMVRERDSYLTHLAAESMSRSTLHAQAGRLLYLARHLQPKDGGNITVEQVRSVVSRWARRRDRRAPLCARAERRFLAFGVQWLRYCGRLQEPAQPMPFSDLLEGFRTYMRQERGLAEWTIRNCCPHVQEFLTWFSKQGRPFPQVTVCDVDAFIKLHSPLRWKRTAVAKMVAHLQAFFRYAEARKLCAAGIASGICRPRIYTHEWLPVGPAWEDVQRLIASTAGNRNQDIRDRAILLLFSVYGLRNGEVAKLRLEDLDWEQETIAVHRRKQRRCQRYPLVPAVGEAILRYLQRARPRCTCREIFVPLIPPYRPLTLTGMYNIVRRRMERIGIKGLHWGPHALRHACASHLLAAGLSLKEIGDHLGHRSAQSTRVYAKVDLAGLREVVSFDLGGVA